MRATTPEAGRAVRLSAWLVVCAAALVTTSLSVTITSSEAEFKSVRPGIEHARFTRGHRSADQSTGPWLINALRIDPRQATFKLVRAMDEGVGLETVSSLARRHGAVAAINAGFFRTTGTYRGESSGVLLLAGRLMSEPLDNRAAVGFLERGGSTRVEFYHLSFGGFVEARANVRRTVDGINRPRGENELVLYTPEFHRTTLTNPDGAELVIRRGRVVARRELAGSSAIPSDGYVISAAGSAGEWVLDRLRLGSRARLRLRLIDLDRGELPPSEQQNIVGGGPRLVRNGRIDISHEKEEIRPSFVTERHPRTAIAKLKDGLILLVTVDGRQPNVSLGMSLHELAGLLLGFGAIDAINLDGGGSTTMVVENKVVNSPSDQTGERPVSDAILVLPRKAARYE